MARARVMARELLLPLLLDQHRFRTFCEWWGGRTRDSWQAERCKDVTRRGVQAMILERKASMGRAEGTDLERNCSSPSSRSLYVPRKPKTLSLFSVKRFCRSARYCCGARVEDTGKAATSSKEGDASASSLTTASLPEKPTWCRGS